MRTSDLARRAGVRTETVIFYERVGLLAPPTRNQANYRQYRREDAARLIFIRRARELGFDLDAIRHMLAAADHADDDCRAIDQMARTQLGDVRSKIKDLCALEAQLTALLDQCAGGKVSDCRIIEALQAGPGQSWRSDQ
jgi:DNA-binding transcriptional MerR regulator